MPSKFKQKTLVTYVLSNLIVEAKMPNASNFLPAISSSVLSSRIPFVTFITLPPYL